MAVIRKVYLESLGCARNLVDSEGMLRRLADAGLQATPDPAAAHVIVVNTCSFIESAAEESIDAILELSRYKEEGQCIRLIVVGCLPQRYGEKVAESLPEVDLFLGTGAYDRIAAGAQGRLGSDNCLLPDPDAIDVSADAPVGKSTFPHMAYLKIAEGCSRRCTYCIIPKLRGGQKSRPFRAILKEAEARIKEGVKELVLVAQDTTAYGSDLSDGKGLSDLLIALSYLSPEVWIRFLYGHPDSIDDATLDVVADRANLCPYFDIPVQHASPSILRRMGRPYDHAGLYRLFEKIRKQVPEASLRTTLIVGFPGETDADFRALIDFVETIRFDHLGVFTYSDADDLPSHRLDGHVSKKRAQSRYHRLMSLQQKISLEKNQDRQGKTYKILLEENPEPGLYIGRTQFQAPEVDGITYLHGHDLTVGRFADVRITEALEYDLVGDAL